MLLTLINVNLFLKTLLKNLTILKFLYLVQVYTTPNLKKNLTLDKIRKIMEVNYFGTMNSINSVYDYYNE